MASWEYNAGIVWRILTEQARISQTITYGEIAPQIKTTPRLVGLALGPIQDFCLDSRLPPLTAIVVGQDGKPGGGFIAWDIDDLDAAHEAVYNFDWTSVPNPYGTFNENETEDSLANEIVKNPGNAGAVYAKVRVRGVAQRVFRKSLLKAYDCQCAFCGLTFEAVLEACHIVPWKESTHAQRLDPRNGLLLCSSHHRLFDDGWITMSRSLDIVFSDMEMKHVPYSASDKALTLSLVGKDPHLPKDKRLWPSADLLAVRHKLDEWDELL
jgi:putative restriction endonuclease